MFTCTFSYGEIKMCGMEYISIISCVKMCIAMFIE
jgi:hypothetical protein